MIHLRKIGISVLIVLTLSLSTMVIGNMAFQNADVTLAMLTQDEIGLCLLLSKDIGTGKIDGMYFFECCGYLDND